MQDGLHCDYCDEPVRASESGYLVHGGGRMACHQYDPVSMCPLGIGVAMFNGSTRA